jgi:hypothetical protein
MIKEYPLMRKATAVWLVDNTSLTFEQIANFCGLHELEVQAIADGESSSLVIAQNPILSGQLTAEEISRCEKDQASRLVLRQEVIEMKQSKKIAKYTPVARRQDKPDGISFLLKYHPELSNKEIKKLIGTTDTMIDSIKNKSHWNIKNIKPRDVVLLGLCTQSQLNEAVEKAKKNSLKDKAEKEFV